MITTIQQQYTTNYFKKKKEKKQINRDAILWNDYDITSTYVNIDINISILRNDETKMTKKNKK